VCQGHSFLFEVPTIINEGIIPFAICWVNDPNSYKMEATKRSLLVFVGVCVLLKVLPFVFPEFRILIIKFSLRTVKLQHFFSVLV
jgi:hypothetical protein